jgi:hypothetical protein
LKKYNLKGKGRKQSSPNLHGGVFDACKWEKINNGPLHVNLEYITSQI